MEQKTINSCAAMMVAFILILCCLPLIACGIMLLWNWLMPAIFGIGTITFWQAMGLQILTGFLFRASAASTALNSKSNH